MTIASTTTVSRETLFDQVWSKPMRTLAQEYGVSDVALAKACRRANIPIPAQGHWNKIFHGKRGEEKPKLPSAESERAGDITITRSALRHAAVDFDPAVVSCAEAVASGAVRLQVADTLRSPHSAVRQRPAGKATPGKDGFPENAKVLPVDVGREHRDRALRILDALAKALEARGYAVTAAGALIEGQQIPFAVSERTDKVLHVPTPKELARKKEHPWERLPTWDHVPNGRLTIYSEVYVWWRRDLIKRWSDGRRTRLEDTLQDVLVGLVALGAALRQRADEERAKEERRTEAERQRAEMERQERISAARDEHIVNGADRLRRATDIRTLVAAAESRSAAEGANRTSVRLMAWLERARTVAARLDPLSDGLEAMLRDHEDTAEKEAQKPPPNPWDRYRS